jgi:hypothetical protein
VLTVLCKRPPRAGDIRLASLLIFLLIHSVKPALSHHQRSWRHNLTGEDAIILSDRKPRRALAVGVGADIQWKRQHEDSNG